MKVELMDKIRLPGDFWSMVCDSLVVVHTRYTDLTLLNAYFRLSQISNIDILPYRLVFDGDAVSFCAFRIVNAFECVW